MSPQAALDYAAQVYCRDRTESQAWSVYLEVEKAGMVDQLRAWFGRNLGTPILPLGGNAGHTFKVDVVADVAAAKRPAVLLYAGDFDASGENIYRDFIKHTDCWDKIVRVGLTWEQIEQFGLTVAVGKAKDSRAPGFIERHGSNMQVELDALNPEYLRALFAHAIDGYWDASAHEAVLVEEHEERRQPHTLARDGDACERLVRAESGRPSLPRDPQVIPAGSPTRITPWRCMWAGRAGWRSSPEQGTSGSRAAGCWPPAGRGGTRRA